MIGKRTFYPNAQARAYVQDILDTGRISYGKYSKELEHRFAAMHGCQYGVLSNSGTSSLQVALQTCKERGGWEDGGEIIVPALTFCATVNVILHNRLKPVLVDVDSKTYNIDPDGVAQAINRATQAIMPVHLLGQPANMTAIKEVIREHQNIGRHNWVQTIADSCESVLSGDIGDIGCFSFYNAHHIQAGVGGIAITNYSGYARHMRSLVNHGLDVSELGPDDEYDPMMLARIFSFTSIGHSFRITELEAALALSQLDDLPASVAKRQEHASYLTENLQDLTDRLQLPYTAPGNSHSFMMYGLTCKQEGHRDNLRAYLHEQGIGSRLLLPLTNQPVYKGLFREADYPVAAWVNRNGFYIGLHPGMDRQELDKIIEVLHDFYQGNG